MAEAEKPTTRREARRKKLDQVVEQVQADLVSKGKTHVKVERIGDQIVVSRVDDQPTP